MGLGAIPLLVRGLGAEPYGVVGIVTVLAGQLGVLHLGVGPAATRLIAQRRGSGDARAMDDAMAGSLGVAALASAVVAVVFAAVAPRAWTGWFNVSEEVLPLALAAVPAAAVQVALTPANAAMYGLLLRQGDVRRARAPVWAAGDRAAARGRARGRDGRRGGRSAVDVCGGRCSRAGVGARGGAVGTPRADLPRAHLGRAMAPVLRVGLPFALGSVPAALLVDVEKLVLGLRASVEAFTYYSVPYNGVLKLSLIGAAAGMVLLPRVTAEMAAGAVDEAVRLTRASTRLLAATMLVVLIPVMVITPELLRVWVGEEFAFRFAIA